MTDQTALQQLREWIAARIEGKASVSLPDVATEAARHFSEDGAFMRALFADRLRALVYDEAQRVFQRTRPAAIKLGDEMVDKAELEKRADALRSKWDKWLEKAGEAHHRLLTMNRAQLLTAAIAREAQADEQFKRATFLRHLADGLRRNETVEKRFTPAEIEAVWRRVHGAERSDSEPTNTEKAA